MFSAHPLGQVTAVAITSILCVGAMLPQQAFAASQDVRATLWYYAAAAPAASVRIVLDETKQPEYPRLVCTSVGSAWNCRNAEDVMAEELRALGKNGEQIARARARVLQILEEPNTCAEWFRQKDANAAGTFRTLSFLLDAKGAKTIQAIKGDWPDVTLKYPYVARVIQDGGAYQTITLNSNGAFFQGEASLIETRIEGGVVRFLPPLNLRVGPYRGGTIAAQVATFLHEFGHVEGLLPVDEGDVQGRSKHNTQEVVQYCQPEIEGSGKRGNLTASR